MATHQDVHVVIEVVGNDGLVLIEAVDIGPEDVRLSSLTAVGEQAIAQTVGQQGLAVNIGHGDIEHQEAQFLVGIVLIIEHIGHLGHGRLVNDRCQCYIAQQVIPAHLNIIGTDAIPLMSDKGSSLGIQRQRERLGIIGLGRTSHEIERIDFASENKRAEVLAVVKHIAVALAVTLHPCLGQVGAQALHIDIVTIKAHLGSAHQGIALEPLVNILIVAHVNAREHIRLSLQTLGHNHGSQVGSERHLAVILEVPAQLVGMGILEDVAHLVLVQDKDTGTLVKIKHSIDEFIGAIAQRRDRIEV